MIVWLFDCWLFDCLIADLLDCFIDCLIDWLIVWLFDWLFDWVIDYWIVRLFGCLIVWLLDCLIIWLSDCAIAWLFDCLIAWLVDCLILSSTKSRSRQPIGKFQRNASFGTLKLQKLGALDASRAPTKGHTLIVWLFDCLTDCLIVWLVMPRTKIFILIFEGFAPHHMNKNNFTPEEVGAKPLRTSIIPQDLGTKLAVTIIIPVELL